MLQSHEFHFLEKIFICLNTPYIKEEILLRSNLIISINRAYNNKPSSVIIEVSGTPPLFTLFMDLYQPNPTLLVNSKLIENGSLKRYKDTINIIKNFLKEYYNE